MTTYGPFDCDAWTAGPYGGVGEFLRLVVAELLDRAPDLVERLMWLPWQEASAATSRSLRSKSRADGPWQSSGKMRSPPGRPPTLHHGAIVARRAPV